MKLARLISTGLLISIFMLFPGCAGDSDDSDTKDLGGAAYSISGIVTQGTFTGAGLAGVVVSLASAATATVTTNTDVNGTYTFSPVSNGTYTITASLGGHDVLPAGIVMLVSDASVTGMDFMAQPILLGATNSSRFTEKDSTVTDTKTGLTWQKRDDGIKRTWYDAGTYCHSVGLPGFGWRVPTRDELLGIVDTGRQQPPKIYPIFTNTKCDWYWSSTTKEHYEPHAWFVDFDSASAGYWFKELHNYVRCVRLTDWLIPANRE